MFASLFNKAETVHLLYKTGTLYLFPTQPDLVFFFCRGVVGRFTLFAVFCHSQVLYIRELCRSYVGFVLWLKIKLDYNQLKIQPGTKFLPSSLYGKNNNVRDYSVVEHQLNSCW
jgi:hypothetical protein